MTTVLEARSASAIQLAVQRALSELRLSITIEHQYVKEAMYYLRPFLHTAWKKVFLAMGDS
jgi:hypothetical protein